MNRGKMIALSVLGLAAVLCCSPASAQRRGGGGERGGNMQRGGGGGFGGGLPSEGGRGGESREREGGGGMGPYGRSESGGGNRPGMSPRPGGEETGRPGTAARPAGDGSGTARPGMNAGSRPGVGTRPGTGAYSNGSVARPGMSNASGAYANRPYGTYHVPTADMADQGAAVRAAGTYPNYTAGAYAARPNAWPPTNLANDSLYAHPDYGAVAAYAGLNRQPQAYQYGGNVVVQPQAVYVNGDNVGSPQQYSSQASNIATAGSSDPPANSTWQPLGVFAMIQGDQKTSDDTFQLAINQQGMLRGNYNNLKDNSTVALTGSVDPKTQRAAWTIGGDKSPVYEAGISDLSGTEATMLLHTPDGQILQFTLVRLDQPSQ